MEELKAAELELSNLQSEIARLEAESVALNAEESAFWRSRNAFSLSLEEFQNERDEINIKYDHDAKLLERLQRTNVYNDAFCITHDGFFGVINGLRLGRLPNKQVSRPCDMGLFQVEWSEINAAWGQTLLLVATVAEKLNFQFEGLASPTIALTLGTFSIQWDPYPKLKNSNPIHQILHHHQNQQC